MLNNKIGMIGSLTNLCCVLLFAICMLFSFDFGSYLISMFIAFSFVLIISAYCNECGTDSKVAGYSALIFAGIYAVIILLVYFAQITAVRLDGLNQQALQILGYSNFGLFFSYDLLGYGMMALSTFFIGLTIQPQNTSDKLLKWLLIIHGVFFVTCLIMPMLGIFSSDMQGGDLIGILVLEVWCIYFAPIGLLSFLHFRNNMTK